MSLDGLIRELSKSRQKQDVITGAELNSMLDQIKLSDELHQDAGETLRLERERESAVENFDLEKTLDKIVSVLNHEDV